jgi:hypothetical protein
MWEDYKFKVVPSTCTPTQFRDFKSTFYSGVFSVLTILKNNELQNESLIRDEVLENVLKFMEEITNQSKIEEWLINSSSTEELLSRTREVFKPADSLDGLLPCELVPMIIPEYKLIPESIKSLIVSWSKTTDKIELHDIHKNIDPQKASNHIAHILKSNLKENIRLHAGCFLYMVWFDCVELP